MKKIMAIKALEQEPKIVPIAVIKFDDDMLHEIVEEAVKNIEIEPKWIPCSERLPKDNGYYLTTAMYHEVYCDYWEEERFNRTETVIAWMPLPEPYEADMRGEK